MLYILGFPTPVVEIYLLLAGIVVAFGLYVGFSFEDVDRDDVVGEDQEDRLEDDEQMTEVSG